MAKTNFQTIDEYIDTFPKNVQGMLKTIRRTIHKTLPGGEEAISYQIPTVKLKGKYVIYFAGFKNHISMYPFSAAMEKSIKGASKYKTSGKGTIQFPLDKPLPLGLILKIVKHRMRESLERGKVTKRK